MNSKGLLQSNKVVPIHSPTDCGSPVQPKAGRLDPPPGEEPNAMQCDNLLGRHSPEFFDVLLENEINRAKRYASCFSIALMEIQGFATYNLRQGPEDGEKVLSKLAATIRKNIRSVDIAARIDTAAFALLFPETGPESVEQTLLQILNESETFTDPCLSVNAGLALFPAEVRNKEQLLLRAEEALQHAKAKGRNQLYYFYEKIPSPEDFESEDPLVLVVDDQKLNRKLMAALLTRNNYRVIEACDGVEALGLIDKLDVDLVLLDVMMPNMDGYEACRLIKSNADTRMIPVILLTALDDVDSKIRGIEAGADEFITKPPHKGEILARTASLVKTKKLNENLVSIENVLFSLANAVETKDAYTQGHIRRVSDLAVFLGHRKGFSSTRIEALRVGGILHDIGKIGIPRGILSKEERLTDQEREIVRSHPIMGYRICLPLKRILGPALGAIRHHHEKLDGTGYPDGLAGDAISMEARILAVADIFDALTTDRRYRNALQPIEALEILRKEASMGKVDPDLVEELTGVIETDLT